MPRRHDSLVPLTHDHHHFPLVAARGRARHGIHRVLSEHVVLHALVRELDDQAKAGEPRGETMLTLAETLKAQVRFEEDELFPAIEELVPDRLSDVSLAQRSRTA